MNEIEKLLRELYAENPNEFSSADKSLLLEKYNSRAKSLFIENADDLGGFIESIDFNKAPVSDQQEEESEKKKTFANTAELAESVLSGRTDFLYNSEQEESSSDSIFHKNKDYLKEFSHLVAKGESNNDPNAYRGYYDKEERYNFVDMPISEVLKWQEENKDDNGRYRAVGKYQYMPDTMREKMEKSGLTEEDLFSEKNQDILFLQSFKDRGGEDFLNNPDEFKKQFSVEMSKEFASLPLLEDLEKQDKSLKRGQSYYESGINMAQISPEEYENALNVSAFSIGAIKASEKETQYRDSYRSLSTEELFNKLTSDYISDLSEEELEVKLTKDYGDLNFTFSQAGMGMKDQIVITYTRPSDGEQVSSGPIKLSRNLSQTIGDVVATTTAGVGLGLGVGINQQKRPNTSSYDIKNKNAAKQIQMFMKSAYQEPWTQRYTQFTTDPVSAIEGLHGDLIKIGNDQVNRANAKIDELLSARKDIPMYSEEASFSADPYLTSRTVAGPVKNQKINPEYKVIQDAIDEQYKILDARQNQIDRFSQGVVKMIDLSGGLQSFIDSNEDGEVLIGQLIQSNLLDPADITLPSIIINGRPASLNYAKQVLRDETMRDAYHSGDLDMVMDESKLFFGSEAMQEITRKLTEQYARYWDKQTYDPNSVRDRFGYNVEMVMNPILGETLNIATEVPAALLDFVGIATEGLASISAMKYGGLSDEDRERIHRGFDSRYKKPFKYMRNEVKKIRDSYVEDSAPLSDPESFRQFALSLGQTVGETAPITFAFLANPTAGLALTGLSVYGERLNQNLEFSELAEKSKEMYGFVDKSLLGYSGMSYSKARGLALAQAGVEFGFTRAFTYNYFRGLNKAVKPFAEKASNAELMDIVKSYAKGFTGTMQEFTTLTKREVLEEDLIAVSSMFIDDLNGLTDYSWDDYFTAMKDVAIASTAASAGISYFALRKRNDFAREIMLDRVSEQMLTEGDLKDRYIFANMLDALDLNESQLNDDIEIEKRLKDNPTAYSLLGDVDELRRLKDDILITKERYLDRARKGLNETDLRNLAKYDLDLALLKDSFNSGKQNVNKEGIVNQVKDIQKKIDKVLKRLDPELSYKERADVAAMTDELFRTAAPDPEDIQLIYHNSRSLDVVNEGLIKLPNVQKKQKGEEATKRLAENDENAVFLTELENWSNEILSFDDNVRSRFIFDKRLLPQKGERRMEDTPIEREVLFSQNIPLNRDNGLRGIDLYLPKMDPSDRFFIMNSLTEDLAGMPDVLKEKSVSELANKYGVPIRLTHSKQSHYQVEGMYKAGEITKDQFDVWRSFERTVYPDNATAEDYAAFDRMSVREQEYLAPVSDFDKEMRSTADILVNLRSTFTNPKVGIDPSKNVFVENSQEISDIISYLRNNNEKTNISPEYARRIKSFMNGINKEGEGFNVERSGVVSLANYLRGDLIAKKIALAKPTDVTGKIIPLTVLESWYNIPGLRLSSVNQAISMMLKNGQMKMPLLELSNKMNVAISQSLQGTQADIDEFNNLMFLDGQLTDKRKQKFFSKESQIEIGMLGYLGKYTKADLKSEKTEEDRQEQFLARKKELQLAIEQTYGKDQTKEGKKLYDMHRKIFDRLVSRASTYGDAQNNAGKDQQKGIDFLRDVFRKDKDRIASFMRHHLGKEPTMWEEYVPTIFDQIVASDGSSDIESYFNSLPDMYNVTSATVPSNLREARVDGTISGRLPLENFFRLTLNTYKNSRAYMDVRPLMDQFEGAIDSKNFSDLFDQTTRNRIVKGKMGSDYDFMVDVLKSKNKNIATYLSSHGSKEPLKRDVGYYASNLARLATKTAGAARLTTLDMRLKQGYSAMFGQLPVLGKEAASFLTNRIAEFTAFQGQPRMEANRFYQAVLDQSQTKTRGGDTAFEKGFIERAAIEDPSWMLPKFSKKVGDGIDYVTDGLFEGLLASTDRYAGKSTFLAHYMDYEYKNNPDVRDMNNEEFWEYASKNINTKAIAHADFEVERSQTQGAAWDLGTVFGGVNASEMVKVFSRVAFMFGRFAQNRKVGIANDLSILNDTYASNSDKANAKRRLASAATEIGVFKALTPIFSIMTAELLTPLISSLVGWDDDFDKYLSEWTDVIGYDNADEVTKYKLDLYNYERDLVKESVGGLFEGMLPIPLPSGVIDIGTALTNNALKNAGIVDEDVFNIYNRNIRGLGSDLEPISQETLGTYLTTLFGIYELTMEDGINLYNAGVYFANEKMPKFGTLGKDRYVTEGAEKAAAILHLITIANAVIPSGDLRRLQRGLRGVLERKYLTTVPPVSLKNEGTTPVFKKQEKPSRTRTKNEIKNAVEMNELIKKTLNQ